MHTQPNALSHPATTRKKIDSLLALNKITVNDIAGLSPSERNKFSQKITKLLATLKGEEKDDLIEKIDLITEPETKNTIWEQNRLAVTGTITAYIRKYGLMPTKITVAEQTGLSRQTVAKHFKEYRRHTEFAAEEEQFKYMENTILANVFKYASNGDMRAARLYFEMTGALDKRRNSTVVNAQNNYIQINNTILSQENLKQLSQEQLVQIERIVRNEAVLVPG